MSSFNREDSDFSSMETPATHRERRYDRQLLQELQSQIQILSQQIHILEEFRKESAEMYESLKSILKVIGMFEKFCIFAVKVSAAVAALYASWKYVLVKIAEHLKNG